MQLIADIIDILSSTNPNITNALTKAQVLAHRLSAKELATWVKSELVGYEDDAPLPEYRLLSLTYKGTLSDGYRIYSNFVLPTAGVLDEFRDKFLVKRLTSSIAVIEGWIEAAKKEDGSQVGVSLDPRAFWMFTKGITKGVHIQSAMGYFSEGALTQAVTEVRSRLLDFMLHLQSELPAGEQADMKQISKDIGVNGLFRNAVFGAGSVVNLAVGANNTATQTKIQTIVKNDPQALFAALKDLKVADADIEKLSEAIRDDDNAVEHASADFGPKVKGWLGSMIMKAGTAAWDISSQTAAGVVAPLISKYYGF